MPSFRSIHLSNNAIQKNYHNGVRSSKLPTENMWSSDDFKHYLRNHGVENVWDNVIYPGMKKAVVCSILSTQDIVEYRKVGASGFDYPFYQTRCSTISKRAKGITKLVPLPMELQ